MFPDVPCAPSREISKFVYERETIKYEDFRRGLRQRGCNTFCYTIYIIEFVYCKYMQTSQFMPIQGNILSELLYLFVIVIELQANKRGRVELVPSTQYITSAINFQIYLKDSTTMYSATQSQRNNSTGYWMTCSWSTSLQGMLNSRNSNIMCSFMFIHLQKG